MDAIDAIDRWRSVRGLHPGHRLPKDQERALRGTAAAASTSVDIRHEPSVIVGNPGFHRMIRDSRGNHQARMSDGCLVVDRIKEGRPGPLPQALEPPGGVEPPTY